MKHNTQQEACMSSRFLKNAGNNQGFAVVFGLAVLFVATISGVSLLYISQKDKVASSDYSQMRSTMVAAQSALKACEAKFQNNPALAAAILTKYNDNNSFKWMLATSAEGANTEKPVALDNVSKINYSAQILSFDPDEGIVELEGIGYGQGGEKKSIRAIYKLQGTTVVKPEMGKNYALYLGGSGRDFNRTTVIHGDLYTGGSFHFNSTSDTNRVLGHLKTGLQADSTSSCDGILKIDSNVYIQTKFYFNGKFIANGKAGFEFRIEGASAGSYFSMGKDAWFNDTNYGAHSAIRMNSNILHHSGKIRTSLVTGASSIDNNGGKITDIADQVELTTGNDAPWVMNIPLSMSSRAYTLSDVNLDERDLQKMYDTCSHRNDFNGYMLLRTGKNGINISSSFFLPAFNGKIIWLVDGRTLNINGSWIKTTTASRMLIYAYNKGNVQGLGGAPGMVFNGYIHIADKSDLIISYNTGDNTFNGAIHLSSTQAEWQLNSGSNSRFIVKYNEAILSEFVAMGILSPPSGFITSSPKGSIIASDYKIRTQLLSMSY